MNGTTEPTVGGGTWNVLEFGTTQLCPLGTRMVTRDGRAFRYAKAGASALVVGNVIQAPAQVTTHDQLTPAAAAIGATTLVPTLDATNAVVANQYAEGWAVIDTTPGLGYAYPIASHPAAEASAAVTLTLHADAKVQVALTTSSRITLVPNPYKGVIQSPVTTLTGAVVGVAVSAIAADNYGWLQTEGPGAVLIAGTPGVGLAVVVPATAAGAVVVDGAASATKVIGTMMVTGVDGKVLPVLLDIR
jgi:hypothetical protein